MMKTRILVVEDEKNAREGIGWYLEDNGYEPLLVAEAESALKILSDTDVQIVLTDLKMEGMDGMELLRRIRRDWPDMPVVMITAHGTIETAIEAMKLGAVEYIQKPIILDELGEIIKKILRTRSLEEENKALKERIDERFGFENIIGRSEAITRVFQIIRQAANTRTTILLTGESGTGKELIASAIHHNSDRRNKPFVKVNCGALSPTLLESELFGHERGAFTHAVKQRIGRFERADGGTIFLDEISETSQDFQVKLLRVLQEGEFERVGGDQALRCDVRVIAASNQDLEELVRNNTFREDLYYRLNVVRIHLPPVRERQEDIPLLAKHFLEEVCRENNKPMMSISPRAMSLLQNYRWPGNVREIRNAIESAVVMSNTKEITPRHLPERIRQESAPSQTIKLRVGSTLRDAERELIRATLAETNGNRAKAARILDIGRKTLYRKIEEYDLN